MSNTPETDAAVKESSKWRRPFISTTYNETTWDGPVTALCRKLEMERDEACRTGKAFSVLAWDMTGERNKWRKCAERLAAIVAADETQFHLAEDIEPALAEFKQLQKSYK